MFILLSQYFENEEEKSVLWNRFICKCSSCIYNFGWNLTTRYDISTLLPDMLGMLFFGVLYANVGLANFEGYQKFELFLR